MSNTSNYSKSLDFNNFKETHSNMNLRSSEKLSSKKLLLSEKKSIETGRVDKGSDSSQKFNYVDKEFSYIPFHTVNTKLLPVSQKINSSEDINVKRYCTNCGHKLKPTFKFCPQCSNKV